MTEVSLGGVFVPALLLWGLAAFGLLLLLRRTLNAAGFYRLVWHRALFDLALYLVILGGVVALVSHLVGP
jgi:Protein of unknown function (DUF1656)